MKSAIIFSIFCLSHCIAQTPIDVISLVRQFIDIESISGNEHEMGAFVQNWLSDRNWTIEVQPVEGYGFNVLAYHDRNFPLLINSHLDTVPPFIPSSEDAENVYGRGAVDAKSQIAIQLTAVTELIESSIISPYEVGFLYVVGEETAGAGMRAANALGLHPAKLLVGEPTESKLAVGHKGLLSFYLNSTGRAAHSGYPELGLSAISPLLSVLSELDTWDWPVGEILGPTTLNIGVIDGGVASNVVPASAYARIHTRITTTTEEVLDDVIRIMNQFGNSQVLYDQVTRYEPVFTSIVPGFETYVASYGTDIPHFQGDHESYLMGAGSIHVAHSEDEFINKRELVEHVDMYKRLITILLGKEKYQ